MSYKKDDRLPQGVISKINAYLFGNKGLTDNQFLDMRTDISGKKMFQAITYYRLLEEYYECGSAGKIANVLERLSISNTRMGRIEGVKTLIGGVSKEKTILQGIDNALKQLDEKE